MEKYDIYDIVKKIVGPVEAVGDSRIDERNYQNLETLIELLSNILDDIENCSRDASRHEYSMKKNGQRAKDFLMTISEKYL